MARIAEMPTYDAYKDSGVSWLGIVPSHWQQKPLCELGTLKSIANNVEEELLSVYLDKGVIKFSDVDAKRTNATSTDLSKYQLVEVGDFVLNNQQAWRGSVGVSKFRGIVSPAYLVLSLSRRLEERFANYLFRDGAMVAHYLVCSKGVGTIQRNLYWPQLKRTPVFFPSSEEQKAIANFLDQKTAQIDQAIAIKEQQISLLKERKQILIQQAVTRGLNPNVPMRDSGVDWIGDIPEHWEVKRLKHVAGRFMYGTSVDCNTLEDGTPVLRIPNIKEIDFCFDDLKFAKLPTEETSRYRLSAGDVLIIRTNGNPALVGKSALFEGDGDYLFASYLIRLKPKNNVLPQFLVRAMNSFSVRGALTHSARTSVGNYNLNTQALGDCAIAVPPLEEQRNIVAYLKEQNRKFEATVGNQTVQIEKLKEYKTTLINSAVTGKIKVA